MYKHHGIVINIDYISQMFEIVELVADNPTFAVSAVSGQSLKACIKKTSVPFTEKHIFYHQYRTHFSQQIIKVRAEMIFRIFHVCDLRYNLYQFNCEHLASYCATGLAFSEQIYTLKKKVTELLFSRKMSVINQCASQKLDSM